MKVIYAGSFDPLTNGHIDIIKRTKKLFGEVIVVILDNINKNYLFTVEERLELLKKVFKNDKGIEFDSFDGLLVDYATSKNCKLIVRGLRNQKDYQNEYDTAMANKYYENSIETMFMLSSCENIFVSSSIVKEIAFFNGDLSLFVPDIVEKEVKRKLNGGKKWMY